MLDNKKNNLESIIKIDDNKEEQDESISPALLQEILI